jgi:hypothetical protein
MMKKCNFLIFSPVADTSYSFLSKQCLEILQPRDKVKTLGKSVTLEDENRRKPVAHSRHQSIQKSDFDVNEQKGKRDRHA